jgi:hypothetical protein
VRARGKYDCQGENRMVKREAECDEVKKSSRPSHQQVKRLGKKSWREFQPTGIAGLESL